MLLNRLEKAAMNNPVRSFLQRRLEARRLLAMGGAVSGGTVLELGCGRGVGTEIILDLFQAGRVEAFDLDPHMVALAQHRLAARGDRVRLWIGDAERIPVESNRYEAVFDFGILHHVPNWQAALRETQRVLKPGGRFYAEEVLAPLLVQPVFRRLFDHPQQNRFDHDRFVQGLLDCGFVVQTTRQLGRGFGWFVADKPR